MATELPDAHRTPPATEPLALKLNEGLGAVSEARKTVLLECRLCGGRLTVTLPWGGRPQGPQCQCNPNTWGNWRRVNMAACEVVREWRKCWRSDCDAAKCCVAPNVRAERPGTAKEKL